MSDDTFKVATINEDGDVEVVGEIEDRDALVGFLASVRPPECPYTHAHTKHWCGYDGCRES